MRIKFFASYAYLVGVLMLFGMYSCQTEPLDSEQSLNATSNSASKTSSAILDWSCSTTATEVDLLAGQTMLVGKVKVEVVDSDYKITYEITADGYCLTSTHLSVVESPELFPNNNGNPTNGHFEYGDDMLDCVTSATYYVPTSKGTYIAAHAVVNCVSDVTSEAFEQSLPEQVDVCVTAKGVPESYLEIEIAEGNSLSGLFDAWCVDQDATLNNNECFTADVYSSYETLPVGKFEKPENFGAVNWLMNQGFIGTEATPELGNYTFGDIQIAIWNLVDDSVCSVCQFTGPYDNDRINMLVEMALAHNDFVPGCGDDIVIILVPTDDKQSIFITIPAPCGDCEETAWGDGCAFPGKNWATYFQYDAGL